MLLPTGATLSILLLFVGFTLIEARTRLVLFAQKTIYFAIQSIYTVSATLFRTPVFNVSLHIILYAFFDLVSELPCSSAVDPEFKLQFFCLVLFPILSIKNQDFSSPHKQVIDTY